MQTDHLDKTQQEAVNELYQKLNKFAEKATDLSWDNPSSCFPLVTSTFGILGGRGAGKSTLLTHFCLQISKQNKRHDKNALSLREKVIVFKALDCSVLPRDCEPGMVVLSHILNGLKQADSLLNKIKPAQRQELLEELEHIIGLYTHVGDGYNDFSLELSSTPEDYGNFLAKGLDDRLNLKEQLSCWLKKLFKALRQESYDDPCENTKKPSPSILVIPLDDFDLAYDGNQIRKWLASLLDELCQSRLVFVLTADFYRLEHLNWKANDHIDDKTGRALLNKLLPLQNRIMLLPWHGGCRANFKPSEVKESMQISCCCGNRVSLKNANAPELNCPKCQQILSANKTLWQIIEKVSNPEYSNPAVVYSLLPELPRGLEGLYLALQETRSAMVPEDFWHLLATSRSEPLLSRRFLHGNKETWALELHLEDRDMSVEQWAVMVDNAAKRAKPFFKESKEEKTIEFLDSLTPMDLVIKGDREDMEANYKSSNTKHDPLYHDQLHIRPLRDAAEIERPLWVELLLDNELADNSRYRSQFLLDWRPLKARLDLAKFYFSGTLTGLVELWENNPGIGRSVFYWLHHQSVSSFNIGWPPLFAALREERNPIDPNLFTRLYVDPRQIEGDTPTADVLELLPNRLWALILFVDGLHRCPWSAFSGASVWPMEIYLGLAAAFVRSAYAYALDKAYPGLARMAEKIAEEDAKQPQAKPAPPPIEFSDHQKRFLDVIKHYDERKLLCAGRDKLHPETVLESLGKLFFDVNWEDDDKWVLTVEHIKNSLENSPSRDYEMESLVQATHSYLQSPVYTSVKDLLRPHCKRATAALLEDDQRRVTGEAEE